MAMDVDILSSITTRETCAILFREKLIDDKVKGLDLGADDYITKTISI